MNPAGKRQVLKKLAIDEETFRKANKLFPVLWPNYYLGLVNSDPKTDPIARLGRPLDSELEPNPGDLEDPVSDVGSRVGPHLVRKHADRIIVLATKRCHFYCRFCFRRGETVQGKEELRDQDWHEVFSYLRQNPEIQEVIFSGGDPFTLSNQRLSWLIEQCGSISSLKKIRFHTRAPVHFPARITEQLVKHLTSPMPLTIVTHFNHFKELTQESFQAIHRLKKIHQIVLKNQSVLLAGVNDCPTVLGPLFRGLMSWGVLPYYLHHPDRASGNHLFRVPLARGKALFTALAFAADLQASLPAYVLDLPDGTGKIPVSDLEQQLQGGYCYHHLSGKVSTYHDIPAEAYLFSPFSC